MQRKLQVVLGLLVLSVIAMGAYFLWMDQVTNQGELSKGETVTSQGELSKGEARRVVDDMIGGVIERVDYASSQDGRQFIAALRKPYRNGTSKLHLLEDYGGSYVERWTSDELYSDPDTLILQDATKDGMPDVFWQVESIGNVIGFISFKTYDPSSETTYSADLMVSAGGGSSNNIVLGEELQNAESEVQNFIERRVAEHPRYRKPQLEEGSREPSWTEKYGAFPEKETGQVNLDPDTKPIVEGECPDCPQSIYDSLKVGKWRYVSVFKEDVYAVNTQSDAYYMVYRSVPVYDYVVEIEQYGRSCIKMTEKVFSGPHKTFYYQPSSKILSWDSSVCG